MRSHITVLAVLTALPLCALAQTAAQPPPDGAIVQALRYQRDIAVERELAAMTRILTLQQQLETLTKERDSLLEKPKDQK